MTRATWSWLAWPALLAALIYAPTLRVGFLYDDHLLIESNSSLRTCSFADIRRDFTSGVFDSREPINFYRPLQIVMTRVEYALWGLNPLPYHITNLLLHIGSTVLWGVLLIVLGFPKRTSLFASCLFALHPIIVEALLMVSGRGEMLGLFFTLASLILWLQSDKRLQFLGYGTFVLALLSKESAVMAPAFFALALYLKRELPRRSLSLIPMIVTLGLFLAWRGHVVGRMLPSFNAKQTLQFGLMEFPKVVFTYARILWVPWDLHTDRLLPPLGSHWYLYGIGLLVLTGGMLKSRARWALFSLLWFIAALLPKAVLMMSGSFMSDHWAYAALPAIALSTAIGTVYLWKATNLTVRRFGQALLVLLLVSEGAVTLWNIDHRNTDEKLYREALNYDASWTMTYNLGLDLLHQRRFKEAIPYLEEAQRRDPTNTNASVQQALAYGYWTDGQSERALHLMDTLHRTYPNNPLFSQLLHDAKSPSRKP